jgi:hypothetical protein
MPRADNVPCFADLEGLSIGDIAELPPEMLLELQTTALVETARVKRLKDRFEAALAQRYGAATEAERLAHPRHARLAQWLRRGENGGRVGRRDPPPPSAMGLGRATDP